MRSRHSVGIERGEDIFDLIRSGSGGGGGGGSGGIL